ncbi:hypothetical protein ACLOJK_029902 [Asimina triloba]
MPLILLLLHHRQLLVSCPRHYCCYFYYYPCYGYSYYVAEVEGDQGEECRQPLICGFTWEPSSVDSLSDQASGEGLSLAPAGVASELIPVADVKELELEEGVAKVESSNTIKSFDIIAKSGVLANEAHAQATDPTTRDCVDPQGINMTNVDEVTIEPEMATEVRVGHEFANKVTVELKTVVRVGSSHESVRGETVTTELKVATEVATEAMGKDDIKQDISSVMGDGAEVGASGAEEVDDEESTESS